MTFILEAVRGHTNPLAQQALVRNARYRRLWVQQRDANALPNCRTSDAGQAALAPETQSPAIHPLRKAYEPQRTVHAVEERLPTHRLILLFPNFGEISFTNYRLTCLECVISFNGATQRCMFMQRGGKRPRSDCLG